MTALAAANEVYEFAEVGRHEIEVAASTTIYKGAGVCLDTSTGYGVPASDASGYISKGVNLAATVDNSSGSNGDKKVGTFTNKYFLLTASGASQTWEGQMLYWVDDATVALAASVTYNIAAGRCVEYRSSTRVWVNLMDTGIDTLTAGTVTASMPVVADENKDVGDFRNLDAVNIDAGSSGVAGSVDVFPTTAASGKLVLTCDDQAGDTAVTISANAMGQATAIGVPDPGAASAYFVLSSVALTTEEATTRYLTVDIPDISTANSTGLIYCPYAGTITSIKSVLHGAITVGDAAITTYIGSTAITGGGLTIATAGSAKGDIDTASPSGLYTVAVGDYLEAISDGGSTDAARATVTFVITLT